MFNYFYLDHLLSECIERACFFIAFYLPYSLQVLKVLLIPFNIVGFFLWYTVYPDLLYTQYDNISKLFPPIIKTYLPLIILINH